MESAADPLGADYALFVLLCGIMLIRPQDLFAGWESLQLYNYCIIVCLIVSAPNLLKRLEPAKLLKQPMLVCVIGFWVAIILSLLMPPKFMIWEARFYGLEFLKTVLFFTLIPIALRTGKRFNSFLSWFTLFLSISTTMAILGYYGIVDIEPLRPILDSEEDFQTGEVFELARLRSTGALNDPNDFCLMLMAGIVISVERVLRPRVQLLEQCFWAAAVALLGWGFHLTHSRGGLVCLLASLAGMVCVLAPARWTAPLAALGLGAVAVSLSGRFAQISLMEDTGQERVLIWTQCFQLIRQYPIFGVGFDQITNYSQNVAHNSYLHAFTETGVPGGIAFTGMFVTSYIILAPKRMPAETSLRRIHVRMFGIMAGFAVGLLSLSRVAVLPTYLLLGLTAAYSEIRDRESGLPPSQPLNGPLATKIVVGGLLTLVTLYAITKASFRGG